MGTPRPGGTGVLSHTRACTGVLNTLAGLPGPHPRRLGPRGIEGGRGHEPSKDLPWEGLLDGRATVELSTRLCRREVVSYEQIIYTKDDGVAIITLNRPQVLNAFTPIMIDEWVQAIEATKIDPEVRAVIVTGAGRGFCSGADVRSFREREHTDGNPVVDGRYWLQHSVHRVPLALRTLDKPYIAAVNGPAAGAGMDMASMAELHIASETVRFIMSYVNVGIVPGDGGCYYLPRIVGIVRALDLIWTGRTMDAQEALQIG